MNRVKKGLLLLGLALLIGAALWRLMRHFVPEDVKLTAFLWASTEAQSVISPNGQALHYRFNDAGAAHSGFHYTWCYVDHWLTGKTLVAAGFSEPAVCRGEVPFPVFWHNNGSDFSIRFAAGRHDPGILWYSGQMP